MRRLPTIQKCDFPAVLLRRFFGWGVRVHLCLLFLLFSALGLAQERADEVPVYNHLDQVNLPTVSASSLNSEDLTIAVATDSEGNVYTLSFGEGVDKRNADGDLLDGNFINDLKSPLDIAVDDEGFIYVADFEASGDTFEDNGQIKIYDQQGEYIRSVLTSYFRPMGVDVDENYIYIAEYNDGVQGPESTPSSRVRKVNKTTGTAVAVNNNISIPYRIAVNSQGKVYVSKAGNGSGVLILSENLTNEGQLPNLQSPGSVVVDVFDYIHVVEYAGRINFGQLLDFNSFGLSEAIDFSHRVYHGIEDKAFGIKIYNSSGELKDFLKQEVKFPVDISFNSCERMYLLNSDVIALIHYDNWLGHEFLPSELRNYLEVYERTPSADITPPVAACISSFTIDLAVGESRIITGDDLDDGSFDLCGNISFSLSKETFTEADEGSNTVILTVIDEQGYTQACSVIVQVNLEDPVDNQPPVFTSCGNLSFSPDAGECGAVVNYSIPEATDNSGEDPEVVWISGPRPGDFVPVGQPLTVVYRATDAANNSEDCSFTITVEDTEAPIFTTCIGNEVHQIYEEDGQYIVPDYRDEVVATDNCSNNITYTQSIEPGATITTGTYIHIFAYDEFGNESDSCSFEVELIATEEAVFENCPSNIVMDNDPGDCGAEVFFDTPIAMEGESTLNVYQIEGPASGSLFPVGTTTVRFEAIDSNNEPIQCSFTITVNDEEFPVVNCPEDMFLNLNPGETERVVHFSTLPATDNCGTSVLQTEGLPSGSEFPPGTYFIEFTVTDPTGNIDTCSFEIIINPSEEPTPLEISCPTDQILDLEGECSIVLPDYTDLESVTEGANVSQSPPAGTVISENMEVTLTASLDGEVESCSFEVQLTNFPEMIIYCLQDHTVAPDDAGNFVLEDYRRLANTDGACGAITYTQDPAPGTSVSEDTEITITATDENGNFDDCSFTVRLEEPDPGTIVCNDVELFLDPDGLATLAGEDLYAGDADDPAIESLTVSKEEFTCDDLGTETVTLTVVYIDGTSQSCDALVTVIDDLLPEVYCVAPGKEFTLNSGSVTIDVNDIIAQTEDNCEVASTWLSQETFSTPGTKSITVYAEDYSGNTEQCTTTIEIVEATSTPGTCKPAIVYLDSSGNATMDPEEIFDGNPNDTSIAGMEVDRNSFTCADLNDPVQVNLTVNYTDGSSTTCSATVTVKDDVDPIASCVPEFELYLNDEGYGLLSADILDDGSSDNCGSFLMTLSKTRFETSDVGEQTVILTVTDASGNTDSCETTVNVVANDGGVTCPEDMTLPLDENGEYNLQLTYSGNDENIEVELSKSHFTCDDLGVEQVITATYIGEHTGSCDINVTVVDELPPVANCVQEIDIRLNASGTASLEAEDLDLNSTDNCGIADLSLSRYDFTTADIGPTEVTFTVTDGSGNESTCNVTVNVLPYDGETEPLECVDLFVLQLGANGRATLNPRDLFTGGSGSVQFTVNQDTFTCNDLGENTVILNYTTPTEESSCEVTVIVEDPLEACEEPTDPETREYIILYPNPSGGIVRFQTSPGLEIHRVEVFDMRGRFLFEREYDSVSIFDRKLDLSEYQSGVYSILIFTNSKDFLKRAIITNE